MEQHQINVTAQAISELRALLDEHRNNGVESFVKPYRALCEAHGWDWFGLEPKKLFHFNAVQLAIGYSRGRYADDRLKQLRESNLGLWVFKADSECSDEHLAFDGIVLPPDHNFWVLYTPPLSWQCGCAVYGTISAAGAVRLGGDPDKPLPDWWCSFDPETALSPGIEEPWGTQFGPDLLLLLAAMVDGHSPKPDFG